MTHKIRFLIAMLGLIAAVSAYQVFDSIQSRAFVRSLVSGNQTATIDETINNDEDKDGLTNGEESFWNTDFQDPDSDKDGFKDGEEVASGHDPTVPGPDDKLDLSNENVSEKIGGLIIAGIAQGSLHPDSPAFTTIMDQMTDETIFRSGLNAPEITANTFTIIADSEQTEKQYTQSVSPILKEAGLVASGLLPQLTEAAKKTSDSGDQTFYTEFFKQKIPLLDEKIKTLDSMSVPKKWSETHGSVLLALKSIRSNYILLAQSDQDPMQALTATTNLIRLTLEELPFQLNKYASISNL
ncbi:MAG: thrombospondin type 3 repeat-containing protein [Candidatus Yanofskybacteria bacterium]|nr:thrombospondin type 3 repeat-containing protein [Candidatus Yanofskybacteria bacterium]